MNQYIPDRFDIIYLNMEPRSGSEITKRGPCLVMSTSRFNKRSSKAFICPITNSIPKASTQIAFQGQKIKGTILIDQLRSLDWKRGLLKK